MEIITTILRGCSFVKNINDWIIFSPLSYLSTRAALIFVIEPLIERLPTTLLSLYFYLFSPGIKTMEEAIKNLFYHNMIALPYYNSQLAPVYSALAVLLFIRPYRAAFMSLISNTKNSLIHPINGENEEKNYTENFSSINIDSESILPYKKF